MRFWDYKMHIIQNNFWSTQMIKIIIKFAKSIKREIFQIIKHSWLSLSIFFTNDHVSQPKELGFVRNMIGSVTSLINSRYYLPLNLFLEICLYSKNIISSIYFSMFKSKMVIINNSIFKMIDRKNLIAIEEQRKQL